MLTLKKVDRMFTLPCTINTHPDFWHQTLVSLPQIVVFECSDWSED